MSIKKIFLHDLVIESSCVDFIKSKAFNHTKEDTEIYATDFLWSFKEENTPHYTLKDFIRMNVSDCILLSKEELIKLKKDYNKKIVKYKRRSL